MSCPVPGVTDQRLQLLLKVPANHVLVAGNAERGCHGVSVEGRVQHHHGSMNAAVLEAVGKLLQARRGGRHTII